MRRLLAVPDKFRGTLDAAGVARAMVAGAEAQGWSATALPLADGGEGTLDVLGGPNRHTRVSGPLGDPLRAAWRLDGENALIEMARASGLSRVQSNDPMRADSRGCGELIAAAVDAGARDIVIGMGGSASTDGGRGALQVLADRDLSHVRLQVACDVRTRFLDSAREFGAQKGASPVQIEELSARLSATARQYHDQFGIDVTDLVGAGAAGGLAGGLACLGADLVSGFDWVAEQLGLDRAMTAADAVLTGEGRLDASTFRGKVVARVVARAADRNLPVAVICGACAPDLDTTGLVTISLRQHYGAHAALHDTAVSIRAATAKWLTTLGERL